MTKEYIASAQSFYCELKDSGFFDKLDTDERAAAIQAFPDGPFSVIAWNEWLLAIHDEGVDAAWGRRPWSYVGSQAAEVMT